VITNVILGAFLAVAIMFFLFGLFQKFEADRNALQAIAATKKAQENEQLALEAKNLAEDRNVQLEQASAKLNRRQRDLLTSFTTLQKSLYNLNLQTLRQRRMPKPSSVLRTRGGGTGFSRFPKAKSGWPPERLPASADALYRTES